MSYSFSVRAATKSEAKAQIAVELDRVAVNQVCHETDKKQAQAAADAFIDILPVDESKDVYVSMNGYLSGEWEGTALTSITAASVSVTAGFADKTATAA